MSIGISMDVVVCSLCFPITTTALIKERLLRTLWRLADLAEALAAQQAHQAAGAGKGASPCAGVAAAGSAGKDKGGESSFSLADAGAAEAGAAGAADTPVSGPPPTAAAERQKLRAQARKVGACCPRSSSLGACWAPGTRWRTAAACVGNSRLLRFLGACWHLAFSSPRASLRGAPYRHDASCR